MFIIEGLQKYVSWNPVHLMMPCEESCFRALALSCQVRMDPPTCNPRDITLTSSLHRCKEEELYMFKQILSLNRLKSISLGTALPNPAHSRCTEIAIPTSPQLVCQLGNPRSYTLNIPGKCLGGRLLRSLAIFKMQSSLPYNALQLNMSHLATPNWKGCHSAGTSTFFFSTNETVWERATVSQQFGKSFYSTSCPA